jgi:hypothetical protein
MYRTSISQDHRSPVGWRERTSCRIRICIRVQLKLHLLDEMCDIRAINSLNCDGPLVGMIRWHSAGAVGGIHGQRNVAVHYRSVDTDALDTGRKRRISENGDLEKKVWSV